MKLNWNTQLDGETLVLVPYRKKHVEVYHAWMQDPELQEATASEPLSLKEEYEMQEEWKNDPNSMLESTGSEEKAMVGDVNLFLNECDEEENEDNGKLSEEAKDSGAGATTPMSSPCYDAEISVMIAVKEARRQGLASEAVKGIVLYALRHLNIKTITAKISSGNASSISLFEKLGFKFLRELKWAEEIHYQIDAAEARKWEEASSFKELAYGGGEESTP